jgi:hypothetical protein
MASDGIAKTVDIASNRLFGLGNGIENGTPDEFGSYRLAERRDHRVGVTISFAWQRDKDALTWLRATCRYRRGRSY